LSIWQYYNIACPPTPIQHAALAALEGPQKFVEDMRSEFKRRRDFIVKALNDIPGFYCVNPQGAFYVFPSFDFDITGDELVLKLLDAGVVCASGESFGPLGAKHLRFSYATKLADIKRGMEIVREVTEKLA
jgi:aspartate/methionine/tyrosine aminotransferase